MQELVRCGWVSAEPQYQQYHDEEWGVPQRDGRALFEMLLLEGLQAGLSWITVLRKREHYRTVFQQFKPEFLAGLDDAYLEQCRNDAGLIRHRLKLAALRSNAQAYLNLTAACGNDGAEFFWQFVGGRPRQNSWRNLSEVPTETEESKRMSKELKRRGFRFVGPTICYAFMQAVGMVNDHTVDCWRHRMIAEINAQEGGKS